MKSSPLRAAFAIFCGFAIACAVMFITAGTSDSSKSMQYEVDCDSPISPSRDKFDDILTKLDDTTPEGRTRFIDYLENEIILEEVHRKRDGQTVEDQIAPKYAFYQEVLRRLRTRQLTKMAKNAKTKKAKDDLAQSMVFVQKKFAALQNKRSKANTPHTAKFRTTILQNKNFAVKQLKIRVIAQQNVMAALKSVMHERIRQTDNFVPKNASQIKGNASEARKQLDKTVESFDKAANAKTAKGRSELDTNLQNQEELVTQQADNKLKAEIAPDAAKFTQVNEKMAADREHADIALKTATNRMATALNTKNSAKTGIQSAKHCTAGMNQICSNMKKNRAQDAHMLAKVTAKLYSAISASEKSQMGIVSNAGKLKVANNKKFTKKIDKLTGIKEASKAVLDAVPHDTVHKGKTHMMGAKKGLSETTKDRTSSQIEAESNLARSVGKYLIHTLEAAMLNTGVLKVCKRAQMSGNCALSGPVMRVSNNRLRQTEGR